MTETPRPPRLEIRNLVRDFNGQRVVDDVSLAIQAGQVTCLLGPSGCGKSTALKVLNRMHDTTRDVRIDGQMRMEGHDIYAADIDPPLHRRRFGWVAQKPNPFPTTIWKNVAYAPTLHGLVRDKAELEDLVETSLRRAHLWDEVKDHLHSMEGTELSGGQQQRLCIARALAAKPDVLLMDEPTGSIDPIATAKVEELVMELRETKSIVIVTHSMMEAKRVADRVAYFHLGRLLEIGPTQTLFEDAQTNEARAFIAGKFG